jgi:predicted  nucleic acid-binding Zn-ribbon protein
MGKKKGPPKRTPPPSKPKSAPPRSKPKPGASSSTFKKAPPPTSKPKPGVAPPASRKAPPSSVSRAASSARPAVSSEQLDALSTTLQELQERVAFSDYKQYMANFDTDITVLPDQIAEIRARGYRYKSFMEGKLQTLQGKWQTARSNMNREIDQSETLLQRMCSEAADEVNRAYQAPAAIAAAQSVLGNLEARVGAAEEAVQATYSGIQATLSQTQQQVRETLWMLDQIDQAEFDLLAGENPIQAVRAKWWRDGDDKGPSGILYLTDQRLIFEQKEEVATKKVLFIATEKETLQEMLFEAPIGSIESVKASHKGMMGHQDHLDFTFGSGAPYSLAHFHIDGQGSDYWDGLVKRVQNGDISRERYYAEGETPEAAAVALEESLANVPEKCSSCGAPFDAPIAKGQRQIQCEYCGTTMHW